MCYRKCQECWGGMWPVMVDGQLKEACTAHKNGNTRTPVVRVEVHDAIDDYDYLNKYLHPFVMDEIGNVPGAAIYGHGSSFAMMAASIFAGQNGLDRAPIGKPFTHLFIVWDFKDKAIFKRFDSLLATDVVIESLTL